MDERVQIFQQRSSADRMHHFDVVRHIRIRFGQIARLLRFFIHLLQSFFVGRQPRRNRVTRQRLAIDAYSICRSDIRFFGVSQNCNTKRTKKGRVVKCSEQCFDEKLIRSSPNKKTRILSLLLFLPERFHCWNLWYSRHEHMQQTQLSSNRVKTMPTQTSASNCSYSGFLVSISDMWVFDPFTSISFFRTKPVEIIYIYKKLKKKNK